MRGVAEEEVDLDVLMIYDEMRSQLCKISRCSHVAKTG